MTVIAVYLGLQYNWSMGEMSEGNVRIPYNVCKRWSL